MYDRCLPHVIIALAGALQIPMWILLSALNSVEPESLIRYQGIDEIQSLDDNQTYHYPDLGGQNWKKHLPLLGGFHIVTWNGEKFLSRADPNISLQTIVFKVFKGCQHTILHQKPSQR